MKAVFITFVLGFVGLPAYADCVILLHGLARTADSMEPVEEMLHDAGFVVANVDYPSRAYPVEELAPPAIEQGLKECSGEAPVHFVTHSMGGILVRYYLEQNTLENLGRVVMLAPPNQGSEVVDNLRDYAWYEAFHGPAGMQLGTGQEDLPASLGPVSYELGIIAGTETINYFLSQYLPNPDDGKVSVEATKVAGMSDFITVSHSHPLIMNADDVHEQILSFLRSGKFMRAESD